jgi:YbbR domain-containing protein
MSINKLKKYFDPFTLLISVVLALLVWIYVDNRRIENKDFTVSLSISIPEGWELDSNIPNVFEVVLQGPKEQMKSMAVSSLSILKRVNPPVKYDSDIYTQKILIDDADLRIPSGVVVLSKTLKQVTVNLIRLVPEYVRIRPAIEGKPAQGYRVLRMDADPSYVEIMVPKGLIKFGDYLECYPVDISGQAEDVYRRVGVRPVELTGGRRIHTDKGIDVSVIIEPIPEIKVLEKVPVRVLYGPLLGLRIMKIDPPTVKLTVEGPKAVVDALTEKDPIVYVDTGDITGEPRGEHMLRCRIHLPPGIIIKNITPEDVKISVK